MKIAFDLSATKSGHRFRGIGFYAQKLFATLQEITKNDSKLEIVPLYESDSHKKNIDLYHFPAFSPFFFSFPLPVITRSIITIHDLIPLQFPSHFPPGIKGQVRWQIQKFFLKFAKHIITDSQASKKIITKLTGVAETSITAIHLAADSSFTPNDKNSQVTKKYSLPSKYILYVGDCNWNKNIVRLAQTCLDLSFPLVVIGKQAVAKNTQKNHPWNKELVRFQKIADQYPQKIIRLGFVPSHDLIRIYNGAICLAHPAHAEGFGLTILEAMQSGCPVITSNTSSLKEIAGNAALLINPVSTEELKKALKTLWSDKKTRDELSKLGIKQAQKFTWKRTAEQVLAVYKNTASY